MTGKTSWLGEKQIVCREALVTVAYRDGGTDANPRYSIGCGSQTGSPKPGDKITIIEAFQLLRRDLDERDAQLNRLVKVELSQQEWDALASLHYQAGFRASRPIAALFNRDRTLVPDAFMAWSFNSAGLLARRKREVAIIEKNDYGDTSKYKLYSGDPRHVTPVMTDFPAEEEVNVH